MPQPEQLPGPNADIWNWQLQGVCRGVDSSMFFHPDGERGRARMQREQRAKEMCRQCPVIQECRSHALEVGEPYGVWGGLSESERDLLLKGDIGRGRSIPPLGLVAHRNYGPRRGARLNDSAVPIRVPTSWTGPVWSLS